MSGFIAIERSIWRHPIFVDAPMSEREAWMWMIARASWAGTQHRVGTEVVAVERGSFMVTLREMQSAFVWASDKKVRNFLKKMENHGMLAVQTMGQRNARKTHVTICNYDEYQTVGRSKDAAKTHEGRSKDAVKKPSNQVTKDIGAVAPEKSPNSKPASPKGSRLDQDWSLPPDWGNWAMDEGWAKPDIKDQAVRFKDYWIALSGQRGVKADWQATWRNWMRNSNCVKSTSTIAAKGDKIVSAVAMIKRGKAIGVTPTMAREAIAAGLVTEDQCKKAGAI